MSGIVSRVCVPDVPSCKNVRSFWCMLLVGLSLAGCRNHSVTPAIVPNSARTVVTSSAIAQLRSTPLYQQARAACTRHDFRRAADLLQALAKTPSLVPEAIAYCDTQRTLCLQEAGLLPRRSTAVSLFVHTPSGADADCGPKALLFACQKLGIRTDLSLLRLTAGTTAKGTTLAGLQQAAEQLGLKAEGVQVSREALTETSLPALAWVNRNHYVALLGLAGSGEHATATIHDPNQMKEEIISQEQLLQRSGGYLLLVHR